MIFAAKVVKVRERLVQVKCDHTFAWRVVRLHLGSGGLCDSLLRRNLGDSGGLRGLFRLGASGQFAFRITYCTLFALNRLARALLFGKKPLASKPIPPAPLHNIVDKLVDLAVVLQQF